MSLHPGNERSRHVGDHLDHVLGSAATGNQVFLEGLQGGLALAGNRKNNRPFLAVQVNEHGNIPLPLARLGLVQGKGLEGTQVQLGHGGFDVVQDNAPQLLVAHPQDAGRGQHRHLPGQHQGRLLKQQGELAPFAGPGHLDPPDIVLRTPDSGDRGGDVAMVLEEVEMAPGHFLVVMGRAGCTAHRAGKA